jgi:Ca2+-binding RTX toxin-like protein
MTITINLNGLSNTYDHRLHQEYGEYDVIYGNGGNDVIYGDNDDDNMAYLQGGGGVVATAIATAILPAFGLLLPFVAAGQDPYDFSVFNVQMHEAINGGTGDDSIFGLGGRDLISGDLGNDYLNGGSDTDILYGGKGNDTLITGTGAGDFADGGDGNDTVHLTDPGQNDLVFGGRDTDTLYLTNTTSAGSFDFDLAIGKSSNDFNAVDFEILYFTGGANSDFITGGGMSDTLKGGGGTDVLNGEGGNDSIDGGDGADILRSGDGNDTVSGGYGDDVVDGGTGNDDIWGGGGADVISDGAGADTVHGGYDNDRIRTGAGIDEIHGDEGDDTITEETPDAAGRADQIFGEAGNDSIDGGFGDDRIDGGIGNDTLVGGAGNDLIKGGASASGALTLNDDVLEGGAGFDTLDGGSGNDVFVFRAKSDNQPFDGAAFRGDLILGFEDGPTGNDVIDLSLMDANELLAGDQAFFLNDGDGVLEVGELYIGSFNDSSQPGSPLVTTLFADLNGDGNADFGIRFDKLITTLDASDFMF